MRQSNHSRTKPTMRANNFIKKTITVLAIYFFLFLLRKTTLSFDIRILHWFLNDVKFSDYEGHMKGFLNLGEINYNLTEIKLTGVTIEHSNIDISNLWEFTHSDRRYLNITLENGNANFYANWAYYYTPSFADQGNLTLEIRKTSLRFGVEISHNQEGFINFTSSECIVKIMRVSLEFYQEPNIMYDSIKPTFKNQIEDSLPAGFCKSLRNGLLKRISSNIQNVQRKFGKLIFFGDAKSLTSDLGWILAYVCVIIVKVTHDYGVILLLLALAMPVLYVVYKSIKWLVKHSRTKKRSLSDPEPYTEQEKPVLTPVSVTVVFGSKEENYTRAQTLLANLKKLLWWRKPKEN